MRLLHYISTDIDTCGQEVLMFAPSDANLKTAKENAASVLGNCKLINNTTIVASMHDINVDLYRPFRG